MKKRKKTNWDQLIFLLLVFCFGAIYYHIEYYELPIETQAEHEYGLTILENGYGEEKIVVHYGYSYEPYRGPGASGKVLQEFKDLKKAKRYLNSLRSDWIAERKHQKLSEFKVK